MSRRRVHYVKANKMSKKKDPLKAGHNFTSGAATQN